MGPKKPSKSYNELIRDALQSNRGGPMILRDIYLFLQRKYEYFCQTDQGWKNSVRHALSACEWFEKAPLMPARAGRSRTAWRLTRRTENCELKSDHSHQQHRKPNTTTPSTISSRTIRSGFTNPHYNWPDRFPHSPIAFQSPRDIVPLDFFNLEANPKRMVNTGVETEGLRLWMPIPRDPLSDGIGLPPIEIPMDLARQMEDMGNTIGSSLSQWTDYYRCSL